MDKLRGKNTVSEMPERGDGDHTPGWATPTGTSKEEATVLSPEWVNAVQAEVLSLIEGGGIVPDEEDLTQMLQAVKGLVGRVIDSRGFIEREPAAAEEGQGTLAVGLDSKAEGAGSIVIGASHSEGVNSIVIGNTINVRGDGSVSVGWYGLNEGERSVAVGHRAVVMSPRSVWIGPGVQRYVKDEDSDEHSYIGEDAPGSSALGSSERLVLQGAQNAWKAGWGKNDTRGGFTAYVDAEAGSFHAQDTTVGGLDYAELAENAEPGTIPDGRFVTLVQPDELSALGHIKNDQSCDYLRLARPGEAIFGVVSANAGMIGGESGSWCSRYEMDEYGRREKYEVEHVEPDYKAAKALQSQEGVILASFGDPSMRLDGEPGQPTHNYPTKIIKETYFKTNPNYDPDKQYTSRIERRDEWTVVGHFGRVVIECSEPVPLMRRVEPGADGRGVLANGPWDPAKGRAIVTEIISPYDAERGYGIYRAVIQGFALDEEEAE